MSKTWFVGYYNAEGKRQKVYGKLNDHTTLKARLVEADQIINNLTRLGLANSASNKGNQLIKDLSEILDLRKRGLRKKSISAYQTRIVAFAKWYREEKFPAIDLMMATRFLNSVSDKGRSATTRNNYHRLMKTLFKDLTRFYRDRYSYNPFEDITKLREASRSKEWFRPEQVSHIIELFKVHDPGMLLPIRIMYHCFARPAEISQLRVNDINFDTNKVRIESAVSKTSKIRYVNIPDVLVPHLEFLKQYPEHYFIFTVDNYPGPKRIGRDTLSKRHKAVLKFMKLPKSYTFYSWKNTGAVKMLLMDGQPMKYISKSMGHHSLDMTDIYFQNLGVEEMSKEIIFPHF